MKHRSLLFVPAKNKMLAKIGSLEADKYIVDLEDSIEAFDKGEALNRLINWLENHEKEQQLIIRLNKDNYLSEAQELKKFSVDFMLPKFEGMGEYILENNIWKNHKIYALVETARGLINIENIVSCEEVTAIAFGAEDYTASIGMKNAIENLQYQKSRLVSYARAYRKEVYDTPSFELNNEEKFQMEVDNAVDLGFDGKMAINPKQLLYINNAFSGENLEQMKRIIELYEKENQAVLVVDGKVYEKMHIAHMKKIIKEKWEI